MTNYLADDVGAIAKRLKEVSEQEAPLKDHDIETASGHDLRLLANQYGTKWVDGESDYSVRGKIKDVIARKKEPQKKALFCSYYTVTAPVSFVMYAWVGQIS